MPPASEISEPLSICGFRIGVVIVAYSSGRVLLDCISGVLLDAMVTTVVVVDNSSDSESRHVVAQISAVDPRLRYVDPHANLGFAAGCNAGVESLDQWTHVFFVNPDVRLTGLLTSLTEQLEAGGQSIVAGRLVSPQHPKGVNARPIVSLRREIKKAFLGSRAYMQPSFSDGGPQGGRPFVVGQVDGALLGMSRETYWRLGGFDPQFELYYEDVDICARAKSLGGCLFVPTVFGSHVGGASSSTVSDLAYRLGTISRARYIRKHFGRSRKTSSLILAIAFIEFVARTLTVQHEGIAARAKSVVLQVREVIRPGSVVLLVK